MSTAIRSNRLSSEDKTADFILPDFSKKGTSVPPTPAIQNQVQTLRTENKEIKTQIDQVKSETVRKQDESTRVFNLRQAQLVQKIKELESKKIQTEKVIQKMMDEKSSDLARTSQTLEELGGGMAKLGAIKNELQNLFEQATVDRKKNSQAIIDQGVEIQNLQRMVSACNDLMAKEYAQLSNVLRPLLDEKVELEKSYIHLKSEHARRDSEIKEMETRRFNLSIANTEAERKLESLKNEESHQQSSLQSTHLRLESAKKDLEAQLQKQIDLDQKRSMLQHEILTLREQFEEQQKSAEAVKWSLVTLSEQHEQKKTSLARLDQEMMELKKRIEDLRNREADLIKSCGHYTTTLNHLQAEVAGLEASRSAAFKLQEEAMAFLQERREFYHQHIQDLEQTHKERIGLLQADFEEQKAQWDKNFTVLEASQRAELEAKLEEQTVKYHAVLKETQNALIEDVVKVVKRHLTRTVFESGQQRAELAQDELLPILKNYFNQTPALHSKPWHQWKPWFYATSGCALVICSLVVKILWL